MDKKTGQNRPGGQRVDPVRVRIVEGTAINRRRPTGFYWRYGEEGERQSPAMLPYELRDSDCTIRWGIGRNVLEQDLPLTMREIRAEARVTKESLPVAHLSFELLRARRGKYIENADFVDSCDSHSQATCEVAEGVVEGLDVGQYFAFGSVLHFRGMEVRPPFNGRGAGVSFAKLLLTTLVRTYDVRLIILKPYPLQFEGAGRAIDDAGRTLARAQKNLAAYYKRTLNCKPVTRGSDIYYLEP